MASKLLNNYPQIDIYLRCLYEAEQMSFPDFGNEDDWKSVARNEYDEVFEVERMLRKLQNNKEEYINKRIEIYKKIFEKIKEVVKEPTPQMLVDTYKIPRDIIEHLDIRPDTSILKGFIKRIEEMP